MGFLKNVKNNFFSKKLNPKPTSKKPTPKRTNLKIPFEQKIIKELDKYKIEIYEKFEYYKSEVRDKQHREKSLIRNKDKIREDNYKLGKALEREVEETLREKRNSYFRWQSELSLAEAGRCDFDIFWTAKNKIRHHLLIECKHTLDSEQAQIIAGTEQLHRYKERLESEIRKVDAMILLVDFSIAHPYFYREKSKILFIHKVAFPYFVDGLIKVLKDKNV